jgi:hypothetical protein
LVTHLELFAASRIREVAVNPITARIRMIEITISISIIENPADFRQPEHCGPKSSAQFKRM